MLVRERINYAAIIYIFIAILVQETLREDRNKWEWLAGWKIERLTISECLKFLFRLCWRTIERFLTRVWHIYIKTQNYLSTCLTWNSLIRYAHTYPHESWNDGTAKFRALSKRWLAKNSDNAKSPIFSFSFISTFCFLFFYYTASHKHIFHLWIIIYL